MAKGKFTGGKHFEKGNTAAKGKSLPQDIKEARKRYGVRWGHMSLDYSRRGDDDRALKDLL